MLIARTLPNILLSFWGKEKFLKSPVDNNIKFSSKTSILPPE